MNAFEQAKLLKAQNRVKTLEEKVHDEMSAFHGHAGLVFTVEPATITRAGSDMVLVKATVTGHVIHIQAGPTSITCYNMETFSMELANIMSRYI